MKPVTPADDAAWAALLPAGRYITVPRQRPLIVASWDRAVLRYLADAVLSVPPGSGQGLSMVLTAGLRTLRYPGSWLLAILLRAGGAVLVGRPG
jgi:hypothetical protein